MTTLDAVAKKKPERSAEELAARDLVRLAREQGLSLTGPDGLLKQFRSMPRHCFRRQPVEELVQRGRSVQHPSNSG